MRVSECVLMYLYVSKSVTVLFDRRAAQTLCLSLNEPQIHSVVLHRHQARFGRRVVCKNKRKIELRYQILLKVIFYCVAYGELECEWQSSVHSTSQDSGVKHVPAKFLCG